MRNVIKNPFAEPSFKFQIALNLGNLGFIEESRSILNNLMLHDSVNPEFKIFSAQIYEAQGNIQKALEERIKVRKYDPWNLNNLIIPQRCHLYLVALEYLDVFEQNVFLLAF